MTLDELKAREQMLIKALQESMAHHNALIGRLAECQETIKTYDEKCKKEECTT